MRFLLSGLFLLAALLPAIAQTPVKKKSFLEKPTLEAYVRHLFVWPKEIAVTVSDPKPSSVEGMFDVAVTGSMNGASQTVPFLVSKNGQKIVQGLTYDVNSNPYKANIDQMKTTFAPAIGKPNAPVKIVIFSDFQCPHCQEEARMIRANLIQTFSKEVHAYFKEFPLVQIHDWAKPAAIAGRCVYREEQAKFWDYHDWVFDQQTLITADTFRSKFETFLNDRKISAPTVLKCLDEKATEADVDKSLAEGRALEITSTPTMFVNGRRLAGNLSWPQLRQIVEYEIEYQKTAKNAGEDCGCELILPSVLPQ